MALEPPNKRRHLMQTRSTTSRDILRASKDILRGAHIEALPDEILLKIFSQLHQSPWDFESELHLINFGNTAQVSKRWRRLSEDQSLWSKINVSSCAIPVEFIEKCLKNGCKYLNLNDSHLLGDIIRRPGSLPQYPVSVPTGTKLKYLSVSGNYDEWGMEFYNKSCEVKEELENHDDMVHHLIKSSNLNLLEKLSYEKVSLDLDPLVFNNCQTLTVLHISAVNLYLRDMQLICNNLLELSQLSLIDCSLENETITFLCQNLTGKIKKLSINLNRELDPSGMSQYWREDQATSVTPDQITALGQTCPNLKNFYLGGEEYTLSESTLDAIIDNLRSLFNLRLPEYRGEYSKLVRVSTMPNLKNLNIFTMTAAYYLDKFRERDEHLLRSLRKDMPQLDINTGRFDTASPFNSSNSNSGLWEISCKELAHFILKVEHIEGVENKW